jgi:hypothetical protein
VAVSAFLVAAAWWYLSSRADLPAKADGMLRIVTWNVAAQPGSDADLESVASALAMLDADAVALQGLADEARVERLSADLGAGWRGETLAGPSGTYLAVLAGPSMELISYHLVPTGNGDALGLSLRHLSGRTCRLVSLDAGAGRGDATTRARYIDGVLTWCSVNAESLIVLAGPLEVGNDTTARLSERFSGIGESAGGPHELHVHLDGAEIAQAGRLNHVTAPGIGGSPLLVDLASRP